MFRTLLVEDCMGFRTTLHSMLRDRFPAMEILEAATGDEALAITTTYRPDLVLMDIKLSGANGLELTRRIKDADEAIKVVILTSYDLPEYREAAFVNGASDFLCKETASPGDILTLIQDSLASHKPRNG
ncbi:MAG TPA: response regulator transcription factor [Gammaproteobacteria bacterium]|jgi:DNA-binding NarL/FixJ family response regulator